MEFLFKKITVFINNFFKSSPCRVFLFNNLHRITFYLFLLTIPIQTRIIILTDNTYIANSFVEYNTKFLYISDIFLIVTLILYFVKYIYRNIYINKDLHLFPQFIHNSRTIHPKDNSLVKNLIAKAKLYYITLIGNFVNVSRETFSKKSFIVNPFLWLMVFLFWLFITILWSEYKEIALYRTLKLLELAFLTAYIIKNFSSYSQFINMFVILIFSGVLQSLISITQFFTQQSIGLKFLGESKISPFIPGVAKIDFYGEKFIRAYGTFPHSNVLAGFLVFTILLTILLVILISRYKEKTACLSQSFLKLLHVKHSIEHNFDKGKIASREAILTNSQTMPSSNSIKLWIKILTIFFIIQNVALLLTFSRSGWLGILIAYLIIGLWLINNKIITDIFFKKNIRNFLLVAALILVLILPFIAIRINKVNLFNDSAIVNRLFYNDISLKIIAMRPITGIGIGNFVPRIQEFTDEQLLYWQYQPVHNIFLLIFTELGVIGFLIFLLFIMLIINSSYLNLKNKNASREAMPIKIINFFYLTNLLVFLAVGFFDHYFWTLQQGQLTFWLVFGVLSALNSKR